MTKKTGGLCSSQRRVKDMHALVYERLHACTGAHMHAFTLAHMPARPNDCACMYAEGSQGFCPSCRTGTSMIMAPQTCRRFVPTSSESMLGREWTVRAQECMCARAVAARRVSISGHELACHQKDGSGCERLRQSTDRKWFEHCRE